MSYDTKIDELIGQHIAEFQAELTLAKELENYVAPTPSLPYGYPLALYRPMHICRVPQVKHYIHHTGGTLSNNVPKVLGMELIGDYPLGMYNPDFKRKASQS